MTCADINPDYPEFVCFQNEPEHMGRHMGTVHGVGTKFWDRIPNSPEAETARIANYFTKTMGDALDADGVNKLAAIVYRTGNELRAAARKENHA